MAIEKTLKTRIVQKIDTLANWESSTLPLKKGEIAFATAQITRNDKAKNIILAKVGDGSHTWKELEYNFYANAADVGDWANIDKVECVEGTGGAHKINFYHGTTLVETTDASIFVTHDELEEELDERFDGLTTITASGALKAVETDNNKDIQHKKISELEAPKDTDKLEITDPTKVVKGIKRDEYGHVVGLVEGTIAQDKTTVTLTDDDCCIEVTGGGQTTTDNTTGVTTTAYTFNIKHLDKLDKEYDSTEKDEDGKDVKLETHQGTPGGTVEFEVPRFKVDTCGHIEDVYGETVRIVLPDETISFAASETHEETASDHPTGVLNVIENIDIDPSGDHVLKKTYIKNVTTKTYVDSTVATKVGELENKIPSLNPDVIITDKDKTDSANELYVVGNLEEGGTKGHAITPTYVAVPTKKYVDDRIASKVAGAVDYLGTIGIGGSTTTLSTTCGKGDFYRVVSANAGKTGTHPGDLLIAEVDKPGATDWSIIHGEEGDITAVTAGNGLTGGGESGPVTLNVGAGDGITVTADAVSAKIGDGLEFGTNKEIKVKAANDGIFVNTNGVGHKLANSGLADVSQTTKTFVNSITFDEYGHVETVSTGSVEDINTTYTTNLKAIKDSKGDTISVDVELLDNNNTVASKFNIAEGSSGNVTFTVTESATNGGDILTIDTHDSLYELDTNANQSNGNVTINLLKDGGSTADSSVAIVGSGATTVTTDGTGKIIVNSTDNNTTYDLATESNTTAGTIKLVGTDSTTDKVYVNGVAKHTSVSSDANGNITVDAAESKNIVAASATGTANAAITTGIETADDLTTPNVAAAKSKYKKYDLYLNHVETLGTTNNVTSANKISAINGLKVTSDTNGNMEFGIDDDIVFVFDCGDASSY